MSRLDDLSAIKEIDIQTGLTYAGNDINIYDAIIEGYVEDDKTEAIKASFDAGDWQQYGILVHGLKSTSLTIGATSFSEFAKAQELAAKSGDIDHVKKNHDELLRRYNDLLAQLKA